MECVRVLSFAFLADEEIYLVFEFDVECGYVACGAGLRMG